MKMEATMDLVEQYNKAFRQGELKFDRVVLEGDDQSGYLWIERDEHLRCTTCGKEHPEKTYRDMHMGYRCRREEEIEQPRSRNPLASAPPMETVRCWGRVEWLGTRLEPVTDEYHPGRRWMNGGRDKRDTVGLLAWEKWFTKEGAEERKKSIKSVGCSV